jgi:DNA polymerase
VSEDPNTVYRGPVDGADCERCPFATEGRPSKPVAGIGPLDPDWIILGEGPGKNETRFGEPFIGASGQLMNRLLGEVGVNRKRLWIGNATLCEPPDKSPDAQRDEAAACCRPRLINELRRIPGKPILVLGGPATRAVVPSTLTKITELAGTYHEVDLDETGPRVVIPSIHPAFILRSAGGGGADKQGGKAAGGGHTATMGYVNLKFDVLKVKNAAAGKTIKLDMRRGVTRQWELNDPKVANQLIADLVREIIAEEFCAIDLETYVDNELRHSALQGFIAKIRFFGLSSKKRAVTVLWDQLTPSSINHIRFLLGSKRIVKTFHNMIYEHMVLQNQHYRFRIAGPQEDTMLGHHASFPGNNHRLQSVACQFRGIPPWKSHFKKSKDETKKDAPASAEEEADYNCSDVFATAKTVEPIHFWIKKTGTERVYDIDRKMAACAAKMHLDGYYVDGDVNAELDKRLSKVVEASHEHLLNTFESRKEKVLERLAFERAKTRRLKDPDDFQARVALRLVEEQKLIAKDKWDFSPGKSLHIIALLKAMGVALIAQTKTGKTSTAAGVLEDLIHVPEVGAILRYRDNNTLLKGPVRRMFEWSLKADKKHWLPPYVQDDGRAHPIWSVNKISGRWGSENPMSQNTSRGDERNKDITRRLPNIRRQFVAPLYRRIVCFDLEQLEARGMAVQSDDPFLCQIFAEGKDIHGEFAKFIFPDFGSLEKGGVEYTAKRDITKRLEYGGLYGGADVTVWKSIVVDFPEITLPMVSAAIKKMKVAVAGVLRWQAALFLRVSKPPYELRDYILGRRRVFPTGNPPPTDVNNNPNQFLGSAIMNIGLSRMLPKLDKYRGKVFPVSQIHDACYFECPDDDRICNQVARDIRDSWTQTYNSPSGIPIVFPVEIKMGYSMHDANKELDAAFGVGRPGLVK